MKEPTYTLHEYGHRFDAGLAQMWNESDDQWPGTFTDGVPFTEKLIREWMDKLDAIIRFVVVEDQTEKVVGYGDLWDTAVRPKSCYVALLNVHPEHQGKSLARRMLVRMVDWSVENGYDRITIGTWPSNLKAMPLYKKVGFFWKPDTTVHMENYLPAVRLLPAAQDFFARHSWYGDYDRKLDQVEDMMTHPCTGDTKVYVLRWQANGDLLEAVFDRNAQALTGLETNEWAVYARTSEAEPAQGKPYAFEWEFRNKTDRPIQVVAEARPEEGIRLAFEEAVRLEAGEARVLQTNFQVDPDAPKYRRDHEDIPSPRVRTLLQIDGQPLELGTGLRYGPAVEFSLYPEVVSLLPGRPQTVHLQLRNRTKAGLTGTLQLEIPEGLRIEDLDPVVTVGPEEYAGFPVTLTAERPGFYALEAAAEIEDAGIRFTTNAKILSVAAIAPGGWTAGEGDRELILENDYFRITAQSKGGEAVVWNKDTGREDARIMEEIGPAFVPWDLNDLEYDLDLQTTGESATAVMTVRSKRFPGLVVGREITINASPLVRVTGWVRNETGGSFPKLQIRPHVRIWSENRSMVTVPLRDRIVHEHGSQYGTAEQDFPKKPEAYAESWLAYSRDGRAFGFIWPEPGVRQIEAEFGRHFFYFDVPLEPGELARTEPLYFYTGPGDWRSVQQAWRRLNGVLPGESPISGEEAAERSLSVGFESEPLVTLDGNVEGRLKLSTTRKYRLTGSVEIAAPDGWEVEPGELSFELDDEHPLEAPVRMSGKAAGRPGVFSGRLHLRSQSFDRSRRFDIIRLGDASGRVTVETGEASGFETWTVENRAARWTVVPGFHGGIMAWRTGDSEDNHLLSTFPETGELSWLKPVFGGIRPVIHDGEGDGWPGKLHEETFLTEAVAAADARGLEWRGVRLKTDVRAEKFRGLQVELEYLTLPGSNVLKCVYRVANPTPVYRKLQQGWVAFVQVDGESENAVLHTPDFIRKRTPISAWGIHHTWAAVENPETGRVLVGVHTGGNRRLLAIDMGGAGAHLYVRETVSVPPESGTELVAFFALADDIEQGRGYAVMADMR